MVVMMMVKIPIATTPHLIGKHPQHEDSLVNSLAQTQSQQQHGSMTGLAHGSSSSSGFFSSSFFSDFFAEPEDFLPSDFLSSAFASSACSPPSNRLSRSSY